MSFVRVCSSILVVWWLLGGTAAAQYQVPDRGGLVPELGRGGDTVTTLYKEGLEFLKKGDCKRAEKKFDKVLDKVPRNSEANYLMGISLQCQKNYDSSLQYFRRSKRDDAHFYRAYEALGISALALGSRKYAQAELDELQTFVDVCGKRCPLVLVRSRKKLIDAIAKFDGVPVQTNPTDPKDLSGSRNATDPKSPTSATNPTNTNPTNDEKDGRE